MPNLAPPHIPPGRFAGSPQPTLPAADGLLLRPWRTTDAPAVVAAFADPAIQFWHLRRADSEEEAREWIVRWQADWTAENNAHWATVRDDRRSTEGAGSVGNADGTGDADGTGEERVTGDRIGGDVLGRIALRSLMLPGGIAECAYWVVPTARGTGVAPRALRALTRWAFDEAGFERLDLAHSVHNDASCRVAVKSGFRSGAVTAKVFYRCNTC